MFVPKNSEQQFICRSITLIVVWSYYANLSDNILDLTMIFLNKFSNCRMCDTSYNCRRATLLSARQGMMSARGDFLNYALSLMRSHNDEHSDVLPVLDVCSLKHVAYVFQALIYWIKAMNQQTTLDTPQLERKR